MNKLLVNADTASEMLSMSRSFFYRQVSTGRVPAPLKFGRKSLWDTEQLRLMVRTESLRDANRGQRSAKDA